MYEQNNDFYFLSGGGEMGKLIRSKDWGNTSLGSPDKWPQSLRTVVAMMIENPFGMYIAWGNEYIQLYNDAYRPILGATKHPEALGISSRETFSEIWEIIEPMFGGVMQGTPVGFPDFMLPLDRNGFVEECYFDFSYSPIRIESGEVGGVLVTVIETTNKKKIEISLKESEEKFRTLADNIPNLAWMANSEGWIYWYNSKWYEYTGTTPEQMEGWGWQSVHDPDKVDLVLEKWTSSINTGQPFEMIFPLKGADGNFRQFLTRTLPVKNIDGEIQHWFGTNTDITVQKEIEQALKESEEKFRNTVKQAPVGITILRGEEFVVEMANDSYLLLIDKTEAEFVGKPLFDSIPEVEESVRQLLEDVINTGIPFHGIEYPIPVNRYGKFEISYFNFMYYPLVEKDGTTTGIIVTVSDVSETVKAKQFISESEKQFRNMVVDSPIAMAILKGKDHVIEMANTTMLNKIWRRNENDVLGKKLIDEFPELIEQKYPELLHRVFTTGIAHKENESIAFVKGDDGIKKFYLDFTYAPLFEPDGQVSNIMITVNDVTIKVEARINIEESEKKFRLLADSMPQFVWIGDSEGNLNYFNQSVYNYSNLTSEQIKEEGWLQIVHPDDREENIKRWLESIKTGKDFLFEHRFRRYDGEYRWQLSRAIPKKDIEGNIQMWVGTSTDIQDQKTFSDEMKRQVQERTHELEQKNTILEKMNKELQSFAYISSHDLQEPLRKIQTFSTQILIKELDNLTDSGKDKFQRIQYAAQRMQKLIEDLLSYSRTSTAEKKFETINLNQILEEVKEDMKEELQQKNALIEASEMCDVNVIPFQFRQLLYNLLSNSLKFSQVDHPPHIIIKSKVDKGITFNDDNLLEELKYCHISISDNGIGFEPQYKDKIFEVFQRLHGKSQYNGTGIGLAIVKKIVENHNGTITATSEVNKGATFDIYLPTV